MDFSKKAQTASLPLLIATGLIVAYLHLGSAFGAGIIDKARPAAAAQLPSVGRLPSDQLLHLAIGLPLHNESALSDLLRELYDPASPDYRHWWTPGQLAEHFGAT